MFYMGLPHAVVTMSSCGKLIPPAATVRRDTELALAVGSPARGAGPKGVGARPLDGGTLSVVGNTLAD
jgi:hypothetical protein